MTFEPIAKEDLIPLAQLEGALLAIIEQVLSRLCHAEQAELRDLNDRSATDPADR